MKTHFPPRRILVPLDFSDPSRHALRYAVELARKVGATVVVTHAGPPIPAVTYAVPESTALQLGAWTELLENREAAIKEALSKEVANIEGVPVETWIGDGEPSHEICNTVKDKDCDLIVMGSHGRTGFSRALMGSVAERTVRLSTVPVLVVR